MNHKSHEVSLSILYTCLKNVIAIALFAVLAMYFKTWWIALFALIFQQNIKTVIDDSSSSNSMVSNIIHCDYCGELMYVKDLEHAVHAEFEANHWRRIQVAGSWKNICPACINKYKPKLDDTP